MNLTWDEEERLEHNFYCYETEPKVIEGNTQAYLEIKFDKKNLWKEFKILMNHIDFNLVSSNPDNKYCIESEVDLLNMYLRDLWRESLCDMGGKYAIWSRYPKYPIMN